MRNNPRHPKINKSNVETILDSLEENHRNAQSQRTSNSGSHFIPSGDVDDNGFPTGTGTIVGSGANGGGISPWVNDTTAPGTPTGLTVFSESSIIFVTWNGTLQGGTPPDFDHVSVYVDGVEKATFMNAGTYPTDAYEPDSVHSVTAKAWDNAHAVDGKPNPNGSVTTDPISVTVKSAVDTSQIEDAQNKAQEALDKIAGVSSTADKALQDAATASGKADQATTTANNASNKADTALSRSVELVRNPSFDPSLGDLDGFGVSMGSSGAPATPPSPYTTYGALTQRDYYSSWRFPLDKNRKYRFGFWCICDGKGREDLRIGWSYNVSGTHWDATVTVTQDEASSWVWREAVANTPDQWTDTDHSLSVWLNIAAFGDAATGWWITGLTVRDVTESWNAQTTADGKNRIFTSTSEPSHDGLAKGDLWMQLNSDGHVTGIQIWNGSNFQDYVLMAKQVLVAGSVGTINLEDGAITADKVTASEALLEKLLVRKIKADEIDVGLLSAAIIQSGRFVTPDGLTGFDETGFWVKNQDGGYDFTASNSGVQMTGVLRTDKKNKAHFEITQDYKEISSVIGSKMSTGDIYYYPAESENPTIDISAFENEKRNGIQISNTTNDPMHKIGLLGLYGDRGSNGNGFAKSEAELYADTVSVDGKNLNIKGDTVQIDGDVSENNTRHYHIDRRIFVWMNTWTGTPGDRQYIEAEMDYNVITPGEGQWFISNTGARVGGTGEYAIGFLITNRNNGSIVYQNRNITPPKNGGVDNFTYSNMFFLKNGQYHIKLITEHWGNATINIDNQNYSFYDASIASGQYPRYATITRI